MLNLVGPRRQRLAVASNSQIKISMIISAAVSPGEDRQPPAAERAELVVSGKRLIYLSVVGCQRVREGRERAREPTRARISVVVCKSLEMSHSIRIRRIREIVS